jgi:hypothetical protein
MADFRCSKHQVAVACLFLLIFTGISIAKEKEYHVVRKGETITMIARQYNTSPQELMRINKISDPRKLQIGKRLLLPEKSSFSLSSTSSTPLSLSPSKSNANIEINSLGKDSISPMLRSIIELLEAPRVRRGRWKYVVVHHSGASSGNARIIDVYHRQKGMESGLAYHFVVGNGKLSKDGQIEVGLRWIRQQPGGHLSDDRLNEVSIGICLVGNFNLTPPTKRQVAATIELIRYLNQRCGPRKLIFKGHREINPRPTDCPGRLFPLRVFHQLFN